MDYTQITGFLEKFKKLIFQKEELKNIAVKIISEEISFSLENSSVTIKNGVILIKGSPIIKGEVLIHKNKILSKIKDFLPDSNILDIK